MRKKTISRHTVTAMFDRIAPTYDRLNTILSCGLDRYWRKAVGKRLPKQGGIVVDLATGTCDQIITLSKHPTFTFIGIDLSEKMLQLGQNKIKKLGLSDRVRLELGSALTIPLAEESCDCVTMSFGIRNVQDPIKCLEEIRRILKPGGRVLILEFSRPSSFIMEKGYLFYLRHILPFIGRSLSKDKDAYTYLNQTIEEFPSGKDFIAMMDQAKFTKTEASPLTFGVVNLYVGQK